MKNVGFILCFHSQNISGGEFANNDHVALDATLSHLLGKGVPIVPLQRVVQLLRSGRTGSLPSTYVALTFDDGPDYDWLDVNHPTCGVQPSVGSILRKHSRRFFGVWRRRISGTSFVIASPKARSEIAGSPDQNPDRMSDSWWRVAQKSGFLEIGNHGWDHVHPSVRDMGSRPHLVESFDKVATPEEARLQVDEAYGYINRNAGGNSGSLFAYPYGQVSPYLADEYFPRQKIIKAAFTTAGTPVEPGQDIFRIPRFVCGWHFKSISDLDSMMQ